MSIEFGVSAHPPDLLGPQAKTLADTLGLVYCSDTVKALAKFDFILLLEGKGLGLQQAGTGAPGPVRVDFVSGKPAWRQQHGGGKGQLIARALGLHKGARPEVLDATAGLGGDSYVMAGLGCHVTLLEQSPIIAALLADGLQRLARAEQPELQSIAARMQMRDPIRAEDYLLRGQQHELIYLDPMFGAGAGKAAVKKEMQVLRDCLGHGSKEATKHDQESQLLSLALERAIYRVVVKRHRQAPAMPGPAPSYQLSGKSTRFDIYSLRKYY